MRLLSCLVVVGLLSGCVLPPPDQPAHPSRMGRFLGLVAKCGCSDISADHMLDQYAKAASAYDAAEIASMRGYVDLGSVENFDNQAEICAEACSQTCMVNAVAQPLGRRLSGDGKACLVSERDLHLTTGTFGDWN